EQSKLFANRAVRSMRHLFPTERESGHIDARTIVEWQRDERFQKYIKSRMFACWVGTAFSAMAKLVDDHRTKHDIGSPGRLPPRHQAWGAPTQQANASVGVGEGKSFER